MNPSKLFSTALLLSLLLLLLFPVTGPAQTDLVGPSAPKIRLTAGKSAVIDTPRPVKRVSVASPDIFDAVVLSPQQIYLVGKAPGLTSFTLWEDDKAIAVYDVEVSPDLTRLKEKLHELFPGENAVRVTAANNRIMLSGTVSSASALSQVMAVAEPFAFCPKGGRGREAAEKTDRKEREDAGKTGEVYAEKAGNRAGECPGIINLLEVGGVQQVMLEVRVSEISRSLLKRLGVNFSWISSSGKNIGLTMLNNLTQLPANGWPTNPLEVNDVVNAAFTFTSNDTSWTVFLDALKERGLIKILAEPTLITLSGQSANFLAGGEFPVPVPQNYNVITIDYKPFGVGLTFIPTVLSSGKISMKVAPEVSEIDLTNAVTLNGFFVPALTTRRVSTVIELADGQSFAIAGLLKDDIRETVSKFPLLGDIPVLGALFRSSSFKKNESELVVVVTPHLVKPLDVAKQTLPTDQYVEPDDLEFYLLGAVEGKAEPRRAAGRGGEASVPAQGSARGMEGEFGHIVR
ncbi:MAG: type II and III secretion system protein family protein [Thermodesulfovibrionales bacterium]